MPLKVSYISPGMCGVESDGKRVEDGQEEEKDGAEDQGKQMALDVAEAILWSLSIPTYIEIQNLKFEELN